MPPNLIEFHAHDPHRFPAPYPASRGVPQWLKDMPMERPVAQATPQGQVAVQAPTVKQCPPFIEAMTVGYVIPLAGDATFTMNADGSLHVSATGRFVETQHPAQVQGSPIQGLPIVKFMNPWVVKTPPGYSTLFTPLLNQFGFPFAVMSGLVETDTYYRPVHFPSGCLLRPGQSVTLPRGTPIAQAIPVRREEWQSQAVPWDVAARKQIETDMLAQRHDFYKDRHWRKKSYR